MSYLEFYQKEQDVLLSELKSTPNGLQTSEVNARLEEHGHNELKTKAKDSVLKLFLETFKDAMVIVLLIVAVVQILMGSVVESFIIFAVLMINSVISVVQTKKDGSFLCVQSDAWRCPAINQCLWRQLSAGRHRVPQRGHHQ